MSTFYPMDSVNQPTPLEPLNKSKQVEQLHKSTPYVSINERDRPDQKQENKKKKKKKKDDEAEKASPVYIDSSEHNIDEIV